MASETDSPAEATANEWGATWADTERAQLKAALSATPAQRLAWLEEAMRLAHASGALPSPSAGRVEAQPSGDD